MNISRKTKYYGIVLVAVLFNLVACLPASPPAHAQANDPVVRAVLFYSPICGHCHFVLRETLPTLINQYGEQLQVVGVDVTRPDGKILFDSARQIFGLETTGVPFLVVGNEYLVGSSDIPNKFPLLIEKYLAAGGVDWPDIPGLQDAIQASQTARAPSPTLASPVPSSAEAIPTAIADPVIMDSGTQPVEAFALSDKVATSIWRRVMLDPLGNGLAIAVLLIMVGVFVWVAVSFLDFPKASLPDTGQFLIPLLGVVGLAVAGYLAYVETTQITAVCGPVGDCNTVQQSEYAYLFGVLPIGVLGVIGYLLILFGWSLGRTQNERIAALGKLTSFGLSVFGITFSIYLTFLEPFVIGATCAWCIASSVIMTILFVSTVPDGKSALRRLSGRRY